jgi:hypothetical protein
VIGRAPQRNGSRSVERKSGHADSVMTQGDTGCMDPKRPVSFVPRADPGTEGTVS